MTSESEISKSFLQSAVAMFRSQKRMAERAIEQLGEEQLHQALDQNTNSVAVIMKHMAGNMLSRWADFLETDGEKPWRHRDTEFVDDVASRDELTARWERGWACLLTTLEALAAEDLTKSITIRGEAHSVIQAIHRQMDHCGYHVGQIVQVARVMAKDTWVTLTVPRGGSEEYNLRVWKR